MGRKLFNIMTLLVDGQEVEINTGATFDPGGQARTTQNMAKSSGYTEARVQSKVEFEMAFGTGDSITRFDDITSYQVQTDTGQTYVCKSAWRTDTPSLAEGGKLKIAIEGDPATEIL